VGEAIAEATGKNSEEVQSILLSLDPKLIHNACVRRFNLQSTFYKQYFNRFWDDNPENAVKELAAGYWSPQPLNDIGALVLSLKNLPPEMREGKFPHALDDRTIYTNGNRKNYHATIEWVWAGQFWIPIAVATFKQNTPLPLSILKIILDKNQNVIMVRVGNFREKELEQLFEASGPLTVYSRISSEGNLSLGRKKISGRAVGTYNLLSKRDMSFSAPITNKNWVATEIHFMGDKKPSPLQVVFKKDPSGNIPLESHDHLLQKSIKGIIKVYGPFWLRVSAIQSNMTARFVFSEFHLGIGQNFSNTYNFPIDYLDCPAEMLVSTFGVPIYIFIQGKTPDKDIRRFLKCIEIRDKQGTLKNILVSRHINISLDLIEQSLKFLYANQKDEQVVVTNLESKIQQKAYHTTVVGSQIIRILRKFINNNAQPLSAEVVYDPSSQSTNPVEIRLGNYNHKDPLNFEKRKLIVSHAFRLKPSDPKNPNNNIFIPESVVSRGQPLHPLNPNSLNTHL
jgi:hypothetical protein